MQSACESVAYDATSMMAPGGSPFDGIDCDSRWYEGIDQGLPYRLVLLGP